MCGANQGIEKRKEKRGKEGGWGGLWGTQEGNWGRNIKYDSHLTGTTGSQDIEEMSTKKICLQTKCFYRGTLKQKNGRTSRTFNV